METENGKRGSSPSTAQEANTVWFSGWFSGKDYCAAPCDVDNEMDVHGELQERALREYTFVSASGHKYLTENMPPILRPAPMGTLRFSVLLYTGLSVLSFVLMLISACPVQWYQGRESYSGVKWTLWKRSGGSLPDLLAHDIPNCSKEKHYFQTIGAATVIGCFFSFLTTIMAFMKLKGKGGYGRIFTTGILAFVFNITANGMSIALFHDYRCGEAFSNIARLHCGFALSCIAWILMLYALTALFSATRLNIFAPPRTYRAMSVYFIIAILVSLLFCCVGCAFTLWKRKFNDAMVKEVKVTLWHTELIKPSGSSIFFGRRRYLCTNYTARIKASAAFLILTCITLFIAAGFAVAALTRPLRRRLANTTAILAWVFLTISWVIAVVVRHHPSCTKAAPFGVYSNYAGLPSGLYGGRVSFEGYLIAEGLGLMIAAWCVLFLAIMANLVLA